MAAVFIGHPPSSQLRPVHHFLKRTSPMRHPAALLFVAAARLQSATATTFALFYDDACANPHYLYVENFCTEGKCEAVTGVTGGALFKKNTCVQSEAAILALFAKGTQIFVEAKYGDANCTTFESATVHIADNKCHRVLGGYADRTEIASDGTVTTYAYTTENCFGAPFLTFVSKKERQGACIVRSKDYLAYGTGDAVAGSSTTSPTSAPSGSEAANSTGSISKDTSSNAEVAGRMGGMVAALAVSMAWIAGSS